MQPLLGCLRISAPVSVLAAILAAGLGASFAHAQGGPSIVGVDEVREVSALQTFPVIGRLVATQAGVVAAETAGRIAEFPARVGDRVAAGDLLAELDTETLAIRRDLARAEVAEARAAAQEAESRLRLIQQEVDRLEGLEGSAAFSEARLEDRREEASAARSGLGSARARLERAQANLRLAEATLDDARIVAPYPGVVIERHTEIGAFVSAGTPVVSLVNDRALEIEADVPADRVNLLTPGRSIEVVLTNGEQQQKRGQATVRAVVPSENVRTRTRLVRFTPDFLDRFEGLAANQGVTLEIPVGEDRPVLSVHKDAVLSQPQGNTVFVVENDMADIRPVRLGRSLGTRFEVLMGLSAGDLAVVRGNERLRPGQPVEAMPRAQMNDGDFSGDGVPGESGATGPAADENAG